MSWLLIGISIVALDLAFQQFKEFYCGKSPYPSTVINAFQQNFDT
jgi:hypothetical protein